MSSKRVKVNIVPSEAQYSEDWPPVEVDQTWSIVDIARIHPPGWKAVFTTTKKNKHGKVKTRVRPELKLIQEAIDEFIKERKEDDPDDDGEIYPNQRDIFAAFKLPPEKIKVVILGMDPYQTSSYIDDQVVPKATGLAFSVRRNDAIPKSLISIYKELQNTVLGFAVPDHGNLEEWSRQGVFLLNACLTVNPGKSGSHKKIWTGFIKIVLEYIRKINRDCVFVLWGKQAQEYKQILGDKVKILEAAHPSPLSANRGFFGCDHFNQINLFLKSKGVEPINWKISTLRELKKLEKREIIEDQQENDLPGEPEMSTSPKISPTFKRSYYKKKREESMEARWEDPEKPVFVRR